MLVSPEMGDSGLEAKTVQVVDAVLVVVAVISLQNFSHHLDKVPFPSPRGVHVWGHVSSRFRQQTGSKAGS
jgi:hypothetical protein